ncbi:hypothetical protein EMIT093MI4_150003 [Pseudomonas sp. IT-93MI4]
MHFVGFFSKWLAEEFPTVFVGHFLNVPSGSPNLDLRPMGTPRAGADHGCNDPTTTIRKRLR